MLSDCPALLPSSWALIALPLCYLACEIFLTHHSIHKSFPVVGVGNISKLLPRFILSLVFAFKAAPVLERGYQTFKDRVFQLIRNDGSVLVLPQDTLEELSSLPPSIANPHGALEHDLLGKFTGLDLILESRMHHSIVQRKLTPRLGRLTPGLEHELVSALDDHFPGCEQWTEIQPYQLLGKVSARLSAKALVGPMCRDKEWLDISVNYVENLFRTIVILRLFPSWTYTFLCRLLPSYWSGSRYIRSAKTLLTPKIQELFERPKMEVWEQDDNDANVLTWLAEAAKGSDRDPHVLAHIEVLLALASVHTTLLRMVNVLYDLIAAPEYIEQLRTEIDDARQRDAPWDPSSYSALLKMDSVLRESQRLSPPTTLGMKRLFRQAYTFSNGIQVPAGSYVCLPTFAIENDPKNTPNPKSFDGLRSYRLRQRKTESDLHQFTSADPTILNFGYGKSACPGRFFADRMLKIVFVKLLCEYEFAFLPGGRPKNLQVHEFLFPWPWDRIMIRKRVGESAPF